MTEYDKIGEVKYINGQPHFLFDQSEEGFIFKDGEAYEKDWDAPCYVPEYAAEDAAVTIDGVEYECGGSKLKCDWYSHNDLLKMCYGNRELCDFMFQELNWTYPETWLDDRDNHGCLWGSWWSFVKPGAKVWWNDPEQEMCRWYEVVTDLSEIPEDEWSDDMVVLVHCKHCETEVPLCELSTHPFLNNID